MRGCPNMLSAGPRANSCNSSDVLCRKFANQVPGYLKTTLLASCGPEEKLRFCSPKCDAALAASGRRSRPAPQHAGGIGPSERGARKPRRSRGGGCAKVSSSRLHVVAWHGIG